MFPRAMNNKEQEGLKLVKESGLSYEINYNSSKYASDGYIVSVPALKSTYWLSESELFSRDLGKRKSEQLKLF